MSAADAAVYTDANVGLTANPQTTADVYTDANVGFNLQGKHDTLYTDANVVDARIEIWGVRNRLV